MDKVVKEPADIRNISARRSQRRINKMLDKNISEYSIPNPYRNSRAHSYLPRNLSKQLSRMDIFSVRTLQNLHFNQPIVRQQVNELLSKMRVAVQRQSQEFSTYVTEAEKKIKKNSQIIKLQKDQNIQEDYQLNISILIPKSIDFDIDLPAQHYEIQNLQIDSYQSQGASIMSDNYQTDKLIFPTGEHLLLHSIQQHEQIQYFENLN